MEPLKDVSSFRWAADYKDDFRQYLDAYKEVFDDLLESSPSLIEKMNIKKILDVGCGLGAGTLALGRVFPDSQIWAVSVNQTPVGEVVSELGERLHFKEETALDFIRRRGERFDLIFFGRVPSHGIETESDYQTLFLRVTPGGFIVTNDTDLDPLLMTRDFRSLELPEESLAAHGEFTLWQKK